jgi:hypothetical protein
MALFAIVLEEVAELSEELFNVSTPDQSQSNAVLPRHW